MSLQKLRADLSRRMDADNNTMTAYRDYEYDRRMSDIHRLSHAIQHFDHAVTQGMVAMKEIASAFEAVGQAFTELTLNRVAVHDPQEPNPYPTEYDMQHLASFQETAGNAASVTSTKLTDETTSQVRRLAKMFAEEARRMNEGAPFLEYNAGIHRDVVTRLRPVTEHLKGIVEVSRDRSDALARYNRLKAEVEKVERQYARKGKPFTSSKSHKKCTDKRDATWREYIAKRDKFNETFEMLMEINDHAAAQIIHRYLALNNEYLHQLIESIERILPAMEEAYPLNSEYSTLQNSFLVSAIAKPAAVADGTPEKRDLPTPPGAAVARYQDPQPRSPAASFATVSSAAEASEGDDTDSTPPGEDDKGSSRAAHEKVEDWHVPPPYVLEMQSTTEDHADDAVSMPRDTREDAGHVLTQPSRVQHPESGDVVVDTLPPPPGSTQA